MLNTLSGQMVRVSFLSINFSFGVSSFNYLILVL